MACAVVLSLMRTLELEFFQSQRRPILQNKQLITCTKQLAQSLHQKLGSLMELLDENRMDDVEAIKELETKLRDASSQIEDEIELQVVHLYEEEEEEDEEEEDEKEEEFYLFQLEMPPHCQRLHQILHPATGKAHPCLKFRRILHQAKQEIDAIQEELVKVKMDYNQSLQGRKLTTPRCDDELVKMDTSSKHASHSDEDIMVGKNNEFHKIKEMLILHPSRQLEIVSIQGMGGIGKTKLARQVYKDPSIISHFDKRAWVVASQHHNKRKMLEGLLNSIGNAGSGSDEDLAERLYQSLKCQRYLVVMDDVSSIEAWDTVKTCFPNDGNSSRVLLTTRIAEVANHTSSNNDFFHQVHLLDQSKSWNLFHEKACKSRSAQFEAIGRQIVKKCKGLPLAILVVAGLFSKLDTLVEWKNTAETLNSSATTTIDEECSRIFLSSYNHLPYNLKACFLYLGIFPEDEEIRVKVLVKLWAAEGLVKASENLSFDAIAKRNTQELKDRNLILVSQPSSCRRKIKTFRMHDLLHSFCVRETQKENLLFVLYENGSTSPSKGFRWVSIQSTNFNKQTFYSSSKSCRSILSCSPFHTYLNLKFYNLVRVLCNVNYKIGKLVHLRFLYSFQLDFEKPYRSWNLQTLSVGTVDEMNFVEFSHLQHFYCHTIPRDCPIFFHQNLKSILCLQPCQCTKELFTNIPYLKKAKIKCGGEGWNDCIKNLAYLHQLQNLSIISNYFSLSMDSHNSHFVVLLKNLKKLTLWRIKIECKAINILSKVPILEVIKVLAWEANAYNFPKLEHLFIECYELEEIPAEFAEIPKLKSIKLEGCLPSAVASAKRIQEEQRDYGNGDMVVTEKRTIQPYEDEDEDEE